MALRRAKAFFEQGRGRALAVVFLAVLAAIRILDPPVLEEMRETSFNLYRLVEGKRDPLTENSVLIVAIDEKSLAEFGQWPWPRDLLAQLVDSISAGGPSALALNILLPEADRMSPARMVEHLEGLSPEARQEILGHPSADAQLAAALARAPSVLAMAATSRASRSGNMEGIGPHEIVIVGSPAEMQLPAYRGIIRSLPSFSGAAAGEGVANFHLDDGVVRRLPSVMRVGAVVLPSLGMEALKVGLGASQIVVRTGPIGVRSVTVGGLTIPTDRLGNVRMRFVQPAPGEQISAGDVLAGEISPEVFRGKYVIVGVSASGLAERYAAPGAGTLNGLQIHAQLLDNILTSSLLVRPSWSLLAELVLLIASGVIFVHFLPAMRPVWELVLLLGTAALLTSIGLGAYVAGGLLIDVSWPLVSCLVLFLALAAVRLIVEERGSREFSRRMRILESTLDSVPVPVVVCSLLDDAVLYANASAREDLDIGTRFGGAAEMSAVLKSREDWERLLNRLHIDGRVDAFEAPVKAHDREMVALLAARRLDYQEQDAALVACVDITERKRIENELRFSRDEAERASERLRDAQAELVQAEKMASLGGLVAGVAHEINTPMGIGLAGASHLVDRSRELRRHFEQGGMRRSEFVSFLEAVEETSRLVTSNLGRAANLIQSFKRVSVDQSSEQRQLFDLKTYLGDVIVSLKAELNRTGTRVEVDCPDPITVDSYPGAIALIVTNFVMNAITHAFGAGASGVVRISARSTEDEVELRCADDGSGMSKEVTARIFDPFFTTRRGRGGSGLGLYLVFNSVTQVLRGRIEVESEEGKGTTFVVRFPRVVTAAEPPLAGISTVRIEGSSKRP